MQPPTDKLEQPEPPDEDRGYDLVLYGHEQILRASDNGVLVAFAALAFQQIRGSESETHHNIGFGILIFSVVLCGVIHFAVGNVHIGRGRRIIRKENESRRQHLVRGFYTMLAWTAGLAQLLFIVVGLILVFAAEPPPLVQRYLIDPFL